MRRRLVAVRTSAYVDCPLALTFSVRAHLSLSLSPTPPPTPVAPTLRSRVDSASVQAHARVRRLLAVRFDPRCARLVVHRLYAGACVSALAGSSSFLVYEAYSRGHARVVRSIRMWCVPVFSVFLFLLYIRTALLSCFYFPSARFSISHGVKLTPLTRIVR